MIGYLITRHWVSRTQRSNCSNQRCFGIKHCIIRLANFTSSSPLSLSSPQLFSLSRLSLSFLLRDQAPAPLSILLPLAGSRLPESQSQIARRDGGRGAWASASASASGPCSEVARSVVGDGAAARWRPLWLSRRKEQTTTDATDGARAGATWSVRIYV